MEVRHFNRNGDVVPAFEAFQLCVGKDALELGELVERRDRKMKVFAMSDGSEKAVIYPTSIHAFDEKTQIYDMVTNTVKDENDGKHLICCEHNYVARFNREYTDELFSIQHGEYCVCVFARRNVPSALGGMIPRVSRVTDAEMQPRDTVVFDSVENDADYEYTVGGGGIKENIVVRQKGDEYRYGFVLKCENVHAKLDADQRRIAFIGTNNEKEVFYIPAPFMNDATGVGSNAVAYELSETADGSYYMDIVADKDWINAEERRFPVIIDPQIKLSDESGMVSYSWNDGIITAGETHKVGTIGNGDGECDANRMYMTLNLEDLPRNPRIKKAELVVSQYDENCTDFNFGVYRVTEGIYTGNCTPEHDDALIDYAKSKCGYFDEDGGVITYSFDITALFEQAIKDGVSTQSLVIKKIDETEHAENYVVLYGAGHHSYFPRIAITYESSYGVNTSYRTHSHEIGRFGQGSIDLQCGNLMLESEDVAWSGNRMPVTIKHLYNSALASYQYTKNNAIKLRTADFSNMSIGKGFKLDLMQSMVQGEFQHEGETVSGYIYVGENGEETYFCESQSNSSSDDEKDCDCINGTSYVKYKDIDSGGAIYDPNEYKLTKGDEVYIFDDSGRLIRIIDANNNQINITYVGGKITKVTDGVGRAFTFGYTEEYLTSIKTPDGNTAATYGYIGDLLASVTYADGRKACITYDSASRPISIELFGADGAKAYKVSYTYSGNRVASVSEYGVEDGNYVKGNSTAYTYSAASGRTVAETTEQDDGDGEKVIKTVYSFDNDGNVVSEYMYTEDTGNVSVEGQGSGIHPYSGDGGAGVVSNINNLLINHSLESLNFWPKIPGSSSAFTVTNYNNESYAKFGKKTCWMRNYSQSDALNGIYQTTPVLPAGDYTFSIYAKIDGAFTGTSAPGVFIRVTDESDNILAESERITERDSQYVRLIAPFYLPSNQSVKVQIMNSGRGSVDVDGAQLENNPYANAYNMLENGNFELDSSTVWQNSTGARTVSGTSFNMSHSMCISGSLSSARYACQTVSVRKNRTTRETFTLSGWAKGYGLPNNEREGIDTPQFRLRAVIKYYDSYYRDYETEEYTADFSPETEEWQFASVQFSKSKYREISEIVVYCDYGYNYGDAYFDDIQLVRDSVGTGLTESDFITESYVEGDESNKYVSEDNTTERFEEKKDDWGNVLTETTFTDGEFGTIYRSFGFGNSYNDLVCETDARGNKTEYTVDKKTSRNEEVTDRLGNKTAYEYDEQGRTVKVISKNADGAEIASVDYAYDAFDNMTEIVRGDGMKYALEYNAFHNLESIGIDGKADKLIKYTYKNGNGRLKEMTYANGDTMKATYNSTGQMIGEKWLDKNGVEIARYKYVYDGEGNIVRSIDILGKKEYNYIYDAGKLIRAVLNKYCNTI